MKRVALIGLGTLVALTVILHVVVPDGWVGEVSYLGVILGAGAFAVIGALRRPAEDRAAWCWVGVGVLLSALGDLTWSIYVHVQGVEPDISVADLPWLASYVALSIGLLMLLRSARQDDRGDVDGMIDMAVVAIVSLLVVWQVTVQSTISDASVEPGVRAIWASYPILDAVLLALVIRISAVRLSGGLLLVAGIGSWLFSDFFYMLFPTSTSWAAWLDAGWMIGAAMLAAATWRRGPNRRVPSVDATVGAGRVALAIAPLLVPGIIEVAAYTQGVDPDPVSMLAASFVLAVLAFVRALRLLRTATRAQADLKTAEQHFRALVQRSTDAALVLEPDGTVRYVSPAAREQFGYSPDELIGTVGWDLIHPDDLERAFVAFSAVAEPGAHASAELRVKDALGEWRWVEEVITNLTNEPAIAGLVANIRDISTRKSAERELSHFAHYDSLTDLPNRWTLTTQLEDTLAVAGASTALLIIDLDQFKAVNDSRGHAVGDQLLMVIAERLRAALPDHDTLGRLGGDEFAVICRNIRDVSDALTRANALHDEIGGLVDVPGSGSFFITGSIGIAIGGNGEGPDQLLQQADTAMYAAKREGPARSVVFDGQLRDRAEEHLSVLADLPAAIRNGELIVHYQPVIDLATGSVEGVEALVRWRHPTRGLLQPGDFVPIAEGSELIDRIGVYVLEQACADAAWWSRAGAPVSVAVNVSATQLTHVEIAQTVRTALYNSGLAPQSLVVEITETALLEGPDSVTANIAAIRDLGVRVALDDFGTGYSSLSYLKQVPAEIIKIDRSFVTGIVSDRLDRGIAAAVIDLARALGRTVVAEGVETEAQRDVLQALRCPYAQGHLWSAAVPAELVLEIAHRGFPTPTGRDVIPLTATRRKETRDRETGGIR